VRAIGVDLAWADRARTGLCAVERERVLDSASVRTDAEIVAFVRRRWDDGIVVLIDAPLVINNPTGCRPCDDVVSRVWRAREAGVYPANTRRPWFRPVSRGRRLADALGLTIEPQACQPPWAPGALEVYPHTALVSLFGLERTLKYKRKPSRSLTERRAAFKKLVACLLDLARREPPLDVTSSPRWAALCDAVETAVTDGALDRVEDEVDAYVCAYVGLYHARWAGRQSFTIGDGVAGYIVTPVDPQTLTTLRAVAVRHRVTVR
jgi:predicted RNase H-like nuclease